MKRLFAIAALLLSGPAFSQEISLPDYERVVLDNGVVLLLAEKHDVPLVGLQAKVRGGTAADPVERAGMASLLTTLLEKGAGDRDANGIGHESLLNFVLRRAVPGAAKARKGGGAQAV